MHSHPWMRSKAFYTFATFAVLFFLIIFVSVNPYEVQVPSSVASISTHSRDFLKQHLNTETIEKPLHQEEKSIHHDVAVHYDDPILSTESTHLDESTHQDDLMHHDDSLHQDLPIHHEDAKSHEDTILHNVPIHHDEQSYQDELKHIEETTHHDAPTHDNELKPYDEAVAAARGHNAAPLPVHLPGVKSKHAFATFLVGTEDKVLNGTEDHYFNAVRILAYQLLHSNETRSRDHSIPFIVLVTDKVNEAKRERLRKDGAIVIHVPSIGAEWVKARVDTWDHVMTKLRLFEFTDFERIAFVDSDTLLNQPLDGIFDDPACAEQQTMHNEEKRIRGAIHEPSTYVFAGNAEHTEKHHYPPSEPGRDWPNTKYLNAGFFVIKPSIEMLKYYLSVLNTPGSFVTDFPEQNLMNEIHDQARNMPWKQINVTWNVHYPTMVDINGGVKSVHEKYWMDRPIPFRLWMRAKRWQMEGYYEAMDAAAAEKSA
ncbi:hypothetical protein C1H76_2258 [Elsinoe australis]|uniref:Glycosyltransferase family 8 protein n=1 Tax=Elsinoe australis TaxID=40998 RepID=A0A4U7B2W7_9PEZI|nr:hypothetical protein C1H76_2258 [Elsinoe australis]